MFTGLKEKIIGYNKVAGVEVHLQPEGIVYHLVVLEKKRDIVSVLYKAENIKKQEELVKQLPKEIPVALTIHGKGVINRKIASGTYKNEQEILSQLFPNAKENEFYLQITSGMKSLFVSVARQNTINEINEKFISLGFSVVAISIGPFGLQAILSYLKEVPGEVNLHGISLQLSGERIEDFSVESASEISILIGDSKLKKNHILSYTSAFVMFLSGREETAVIPEVIEQEKEFRQKLVFKFSVNCIIGFLVLITLSNYLLYNYYKQENERLAGITSSNQNTIEKVKQLEKKIEEKEYFMKKAGWLSIPKTSFYSDEIASSIPVGSVQLKAIKINPLNEKLSKKEHKEFFQTDTILVTGTCSDPTSLNPWMNELKEKEWVRSLSNLNYTFDHKNRQGSFELEIRIGKDE